MKVLVSFSGGKDSQASLIWAVNKYGNKHITAVFCDTGHENRVTYSHVSKTCAELSVELVTVKSARYDGFIDLAKQKGRFPSTKTRFCTEELKMKPMIDYVLSQSDHLLIVEGKRRDESEARSQLPEACTYFKYYFQPYTWRVLKKHKKQYKGWKLIDVPMEHKRPVYFTYRKKEVTTWVELYAQDLYRPVVDWTAQQVIDYILSNGQRPNELYFRGFSRVGCFPCIQARHQEVWNIITGFPTEWEELKAKEMVVGQSFFPPGYIPAHACSNRKYPMLTDVEKYLHGKHQTGDLFEEPSDATPSRCMSFYHLCE